MDYLLSLSDLARQGALRFTEDGNDFLVPGHTVPPLFELPRLLRSADLVATDAEDDWSAVKELLDAGAGFPWRYATESVGARRRWGTPHRQIPHRSDARDVMAWEKTVLDLAEEAGLSTPIRHLVAVGERKVMLLERFDRGPGGVRHGYISAMTMLGARDGDERDHADIATPLPSPARGSSRISQNYSVGSSSAWRSTTPTTTCAITAFSIAAEVGC